MPKSITWEGQTITELEKAVRDAEIKAGIERSEPSSDSETSAELSAGIQRGTR